MSFWDSTITGTIFNDCAYMEKRIVPDGAGSTKKVWTKGAVFTANISKVSTSEQETAEARDGIATYKITTPKSIVLDYNDVVMRISDGRLFRVESEGADMATPDSSTLDMRIVMAKDWKIPAGDEIAEG